MTKFNVKFSDAMHATVSELARWMDGSMADVIREALTTFAWIAREYRRGNRLMIQREGTSAPVELFLPNFERFREVPEGDPGSS